MQLVTTARKTALLKFNEEGYLCVLRILTGLEFNRTKKTQVSSLLGQFSLGLK